MVRARSMPVWFTTRPVVGFVDQASRQAPRADVYLFYGCDGAPFIGPGGCVESVRGGWLESMVMPELLRMPVGSYAARVAAKGAPE